MINPFVRGLDDSSLTNLYWDCKSEMDRRAIAEVPMIDADFRRNDMVNSVKNHRARVGCSLMASKRAYDNYVAKYGK
jgi:hypothetical protein